MSTGAMSESGQPQRRVLIFGREGLGSDQVRCACAQYLMVDCNMKLIKALNVLQAKSKGISFSLLLFNRFSTQKNSINLNIIILI
jgi:hypothetical protein